MRFDLIPDPEKSVMYKWKHKGYVLITVLLIVTLLSALLIHMNIAALTARQAAAGHTHAVQAFNCAQSGLNTALVILNQNPDPLTNQTLRNALHEPAIIQIGAGECRITIVCENGKVNLNLLRRLTGGPDLYRIQQFSRLIDLVNARHTSSDKEHSDDLPPLPKSIIPALIDWVDSDDEKTILDSTPLTPALSGFEITDYQKLNPPGVCRNRPLRSIDECTLVHGITADWLYHNTSSNNKIVLGPLADCITTYGDGKIDLNTAPALVIQSLAPGITNDVARKIIHHRRLSPFKNINDIHHLLYKTDVSVDEMKTSITTRPLERFYTVIAAGRYQNVESILIAVIRTNSDSANAEIIEYKER